jgi:putative sterol carrier protein
MAPPRIDLESSSPAEIYEAIATMDEEDFDELMEEPASRENVIAALVEHMASLFRPEKAGDLEATIHIKLWDKPGGGYDHFELRIAGGTCTLTEPSDDPDLTLKVRPSDLRKLVTGETGARRLAIKGRLRAIGDLGLGMKLPDLFAF